MMRSFLWKLQTWRRLGLSSILAVALYRLFKQCGLYRKYFPVAEHLQGPFFTDHAGDPGGMAIVRYFSRHDIDVTSPPDWFLNPWTGRRCQRLNSHWSTLSDFDLEIGDIKTVWELSRFDWLPRMAWKYRGGDQPVLNILELWLRDWAANNPINGGVNWKCGQEASLRCLNMIVAALLVDKSFENPREGFLEFLTRHLQRISLTNFYAIAQKNNHGVVEAATLFIVGGYLCVYGNGRQQEYGRKWTQGGRSRLQSQVENLVLSDGSFSQHSVTYHRLMLDVLSLVELLRNRLKIQPLRAIYYDRLKSAVSWLHGMMDVKTGDAPNLGANDGAYLFNLQQLEYRDFRPSLQLAAAVFKQQAAWTNSVRHPLLELFDIKLNKLPAVKSIGSFFMRDGGYTGLRKDTDFAMLRLPIYPFRPSHADGLHLDIWHNGINWVRDCGSYSYNSDEKYLRYFAGTEGHSTVCFDDRDQMPRLGRFLFGAWLRAEKFIWNEQQERMGCGYTDYLGASHIREIRKIAKGWLVIDKVGGFEHEAIIRWHLAPDNWRLKKQSLYSSSLHISIDSSVNITASLTELPESRYYLDCRKIPVLEVCCTRPCSIETKFVFYQ